MSRSFVPAVLVGAAALASTCFAQLTGPSTQQSSYMIPSDPSSGVRFTSIATAADGRPGNPNDLFTNLSTGVPNSYSMVGIPDGLGAFRTEEDIRNGTFTLLMNQELGDTGGVVRAHGSKGAFVSQWTVRADGNNLQVLGGKDLINTVKLWDSATNSYTTWDSSNPMLRYANNQYGAANPGQAGFNRFCSADLAPTSAFKFGEYGTEDRIFMNGEERGGDGRAFAHVATGAEAGTTYQLPSAGNYSWENAAASPYAQRKTLVMGLDDSTPGNVYLHVGEKQAAGSAVEKAGLTGMRTYGFTIAGAVRNGLGQAVEDNTQILGGGATVKRFGMVDLGDVSSLTGSQLQTASDAAGIMNMARPEDGAWDPTNPNRFVFVTTNSFDGPSRIWSMQYDDIAHPEAGGVLSMLGDGNNLSSFGGGFLSTTGATNAKMFDNMCFTHNSQILLQEDVGGNARLGRLWLYNTITDSMEEVGISDSARFLTGATNFLTQDEETSGIIDAWDILGPGWFLLDMQAHYSISGAAVEGGQLMAVYIPQTIPAPSVLGAGLCGAAGGSPSASLNRWCALGGGDSGGNGAPARVGRGFVFLRPARRDEGVYALAFPGVMYAAEFFTPRSS